MTSVTDGVFVTVTCGAGAAMTVEESVPVTVPFFGSLAVAVAVLAMVWPQ